MTKIELIDKGYRYTAHGRTWETDESACRIILPDGRQIFFSEAESNITRFNSGVGIGYKTVFTEFPGLPELTIECRVWAEYSTGNIIYELVPINDTCINDIIWPGPVVFTSPEAMAVVPLMRGCLIRNYTDEQFPHIWPTDTILPENGRYSCSRSMYMQFFGQYDKNGAAVSILESRWDGGMIIETGNEKPTTVAARWRESLGKISYARKLRLCFLPAGCDYNDIAKVYRNYVSENGELITLKQKAARNPKLAELIGRPIIHTYIWYHIVPESHFYIADNPKNNDRKQTYGYIACELRRLKSQGLSAAVLHLDGWCKNGYDNQHPDVLPPAEEPGGWNGMRELQATCHELGYFFGLHDQYRDYYYDADSFNEEYAVHRQDGSVPNMSLWHGGRQTVLCQTFAPEYVRRNYRIFNENGIDPDNVYLDVFSCVELDECFHPSHIMTREMCARARAKCFNEIAALGALVQSEEGIDWAFPYLDFLHHAPYAPVVDWWKPDNRAGIPVPLLDLVYHDCVVIPWCPEGSFLRNSKDFLSLSTLLTGSSTYLPLDADIVTINRTETALKWQRAVQTREMLRFDMIDDNPLHLKSFFEGGYSAEVNFETGEYSLRGPDIE